MSCFCDKDGIVIIKGNDTDFNGQEFLTFILDTSVLDLSSCSASFSLCGITKTFQDLSSGEIKINYNAIQTNTFPLGPTYGVLKIFDSSGRVATIESKIPFLIKNSVHGDSIAVKPYEYTINVEQGGENILNVKVEAGVSVEVGSTETLPAGSGATVENVGTPNHLVLKFGIPQGIQGEQGEEGVPGQDAKIIIRRL